MIRTYMTGAAANDVRRLRLVQQYRWRLSNAEAPAIAGQSLQNFISGPIRDGGCQGLLDFTESIQEKLEIRLEK